MSQTAKKLTPIEEIHEELVSAADLQRHIMPAPGGIPEFGDFDIYGKTLPVSVVGGDFNDFIDLEARFGLKGRLGVVIADASGHGLVAAMLIRDFTTALFMGISFQSYYTQDTSVGLFERLNRRMFRSSQDNQFISSVCGELHLDGTFRYINAGHDFPFLIKQSGITDLATGGLVLGAFRNTPVDFEVGEVRLESGDVLVLYTDGIVEVSNQRGEEFGISRLKSLVAGAAKKSAQEIFEVIRKEIGTFTGEAPRQDDRTLLIIKRLGSVRSSQEAPDCLGN